jgi:plasmid stabilization system protein ParE
MVKRRVVWSRNSEIQLQQILTFFNERNKSDKYSQKLYKKFKKSLQIASKKPEIGVKTKIDAVKGLIVSDYILYYEILEDKIMVLKVWDCRQDPNKLNISQMK